MNHYLTLPLDQAKTLTITQMKIGQEVGSIKAWEGFTRENGEPTNIRPDFSLICNISYKKNGIAINSSGHHIPCFTYGREEDYVAPTAYTAIKPQGLIFGVFEGLSPLTVEVVQIYRQREEKNAKDNLEYDDQPLLNLEIEELNVTKFTQLEVKLNDAQKNI